MDGEAFGKVKWSGADVPWDHKERDDREQVLVQIAVRKRVEREKNVVTKGIRNMVGFQHVRS